MSPRLLRLLSPFSLAPSLHLCRATARRRRQSSAAPSLPPTSLRGQAPTARHAAGGVGLTWRSGAGSHRRRPKRLPSALAPADSRRRSALPREVRGPDSSGVPCLILSSVWSLLPLSSYLSLRDLPLPTLEEARSPSLWTPIYVRATCWPLMEETLAYYYFCFAFCRVWPPRFYWILTAGIVVPYS